MKKESKLMSLQDVLNEMFKHGHPEFNNLAREMMALHSEKNKGYAEGGDPLGNFNRCAAIMQQYPNFPHSSREGIAVMFMLKHIDRILWDLNIGRVPSDESLGDIAVYTQIMRCMQR